ncbi:DUF6880 family protein [Demequina salsinemoris]|uniref:DUF6880 family protein n=1 Tax=Demequina salsinemoris TaxID=577470 RepID=UPI000A7E1C4A|nr:DUF6880 family protein [Demequina salsinemoris]
MLADSVLPLIRTRAEVWRYGVANAHGRQMHDGVDLLEDAFGAADPAEVYAVTTKAIASALKVIARADDSSGIIGDACRRLLDLHSRAAFEARVPPGRLVAWMKAFQTNDDVDYFELDVVAYAPALGPRGIALYRDWLAEVRDALPPVVGDSLWSGPSAGLRWTLDWNDRRLAVLDHDVDAIIRTHARDRRVAAWYVDTAKAFEEISEIDLALDWARQATDFDLGHQARTASRYWCALVETHRPEEALAAREHCFSRWPGSGEASALHRVAGEEWAALEASVIEALSRDPREAVGFVLRDLDDASRAWHLAHSLELEDARTWSDLLTAYERVDALATLPVHRRLVTATLESTGAQHYVEAARRLRTMRAIAAAGGGAPGVEVDDFIASLREEHRRRPRLQQEFDRAGLP